MAPIKNYYGLRSFFCPMINFLTCSEAKCSFLIPIYSSIDPLIAVCDSVFSLHSCFHLSHSFIFVLLLSLLLSVFFMNFDLLVFSQIRQQTWYSTYGCFADISQWTNSTLCSCYGEDDFLSSLTKNKIYKSLHFQRSTDSAVYNN